MSTVTAHLLPRPEDRRRGELERWVGCQGVRTTWRSEGFVEDMELGSSAGLNAATRASKPVANPAWAPALACATPRPSRLTKPLRWLDFLGLRTA